MKRIPISILEYPFETAIALWGLVSGAQVVFEIATPSVSDLPQPLPAIWAILMLAGGVYVGIGLWKRHYSTLVASGITVIGYVLAAYAVAIVAFTADWRRSVTVVWLLAAVSLVAFVRAWWLRARDEMLAQHVSGNGGGVGWNDGEREGNGGTDG